MTARTMAARERRGTLNARGGARGGRASLVRACESEARDSLFGVNISNVGERARETESNRIECVV